jgi:hypothetical protein
MKQAIGSGSLVDSPIGKKPLDSTGSAIGAARMNPEKAFKRISALEKREDVIAAYFRDIAGGKPPLPFTLYVPRGLGAYENQTFPNVVETDDPSLVFTAAFNGKEVWRELRLSEFNLA